MKTSRLAAAVLATALFVSVAPASAANVSGQQLLTLCTAGVDGSGNALEAAECMGFVVGVADTFDCIEDEHGFTWNSSAGASQPQITRIVMQYIQSHPAARSDSGHVAVARALAEAFPCPSRAASN